MYDGGFAMGSNLPLFEEVNTGATEVTTSTGKKAVVGPKADLAP